MEQEQESRTYIIIDKHHHWKTPLPFATIRR